MPYESAPITRRMSQHAGMQMKQMVKQHLGSQSTGSASSPNPSTLSPAESTRNYAITSRLNAKNFMGMIYTRITLPMDSPHANENRAAEYFRQASMPWGNSFMHTPTDNQRLNNPAQSAFTKQRQLNVGSTYGQFYAFMHALSAAFGNLQSGK